MLIEKKRQRNVKKLNYDEMFDKIQTFNAKKTTFAQIENKIKKFVYCSQIDATREKFLIKKKCISRKSKNDIQ